MTQLAKNVLPLHIPPCQKTYRASVSRVINRLKSDFGLTNVTLAEKIGCCADTISNAENENNDLSAVLLLKLAYHFGMEVIAPVTDLASQRIAEVPTLSDDLNAIEASLVALRRKVGA